MNDYKINVGYLYNDSFTEKEFLDAVFKQIKEDNLAPSYIFDEMKLGEVKRINFPIILCDGEAEIEYSRMIGYDRIETTTKYKTTTYGNGYQNKTHSTSSRTITDWKQDSGVINGKASSGTIEDEYKIFDEYITNHKMDKSNVRSLSNEELREYELTPEKIEYLENDIINKVFQANMSNSGNHIKDEQYNSTATLNNISCTIVSLYSLYITVRDKTLLFVASSNGEIDIALYGEYPVENYEERFKYTKEVTAQRLAATKHPRTIAKYTIISAIALFALLLSLGIALKVLALTITSIVILVLGLIIGIKYAFDVKKISKPYYNQIREYTLKDFNNKLNYKEESYQSFIKRL